MGTFTWDYITIIYIVILLICIIIGYFKGFLKGIISLAGTFVAFILAFLLSKPVGNALFANYGQGLTDSIFGAITSSVPALGETISGNIDAYLGTALTEIGIPSGLQEMVGSLIKAAIPAGSESYIIGTPIAEGLSNLVFIIGSFLGIFILSIIIFFILKIVLKKLINSISLVKWLDRLLGVAAYALIAVIVIAVVSYGLTFVVTLNN